VGRNEDSKQDPDRCRGAAREPVPERLLEVHRPRRAAGSRSSPSEGVGAEGETSWRDKVAAVKDKLGGGDSAEGEDGAVKGAQADINRGL
jgi:hypothetical protein